MGLGSGNSAIEEGLQDFHVRGSVAAREAVAVLAVDDSASLEMAVRLPPAWPLRPATIECRRRVRVLPTLSPVARHSEDTNHSALNSHNIAWGWISITLRAHVRTVEALSRMYDAGPD